MNIYQAARTIGITQKTLARKLNISTSTLYRRRVREFGGGRVMVDQRDRKTLDLFTRESLADVARKVLQTHGVAL